MKLIIALGLMACLVALGLIYMSEKALNANVAELHVPIIIDGVA